MTIQPPVPNPSANRPHIEGPIQGGKPTCDGCQSEPATVTVDFGSTRLALCNGCTPDLPRIVAWHLDRDPDHPCEVCRLKPSAFIVDYGDGCPVEVCEDCRPAEADDRIGEIFAQAVLTGLARSAN